MTTETGAYADNAESGNNQDEGKIYATAAQDPGPLAVVKQVTEAMRSIPPVIGEIEPLDENVRTYGNEMEDAVAENLPAVSSLENKDSYKAVTVTVPRAGKLTKQIVTSTKWKTIRSMLNEFADLAKAEGFEISVAEDEVELLYRVTLTRQAGQSGSGPMSGEHLDFINLFPYSIIAR